MIEITEITDQHSADHKHHGFRVFHIEGHPEYPVMFAHKHGTGNIYLGHRDQHPTRIFRAVAMYSPGSDSAIPMLGAPAHEPTPVTRSVLCRVVEMVRGRAK